MYKAPPPEISSEQFYETDERAASRAASRSRRSRRCRSAGPSTCSPRATGGSRCASTCATTTTGRCSACSRSSCRSRRTASRSPDEVDANGMPVAHFNYSLCENDKALRRVREEDPRRDLGRARTRRTRSRSTATPTSSAVRAWASRPDDSVVDANHRVWGVDEPLRRRRVGPADAGRREPGARDHGARRPLRGPARGKARLDGGQGLEPARPARAAPRRAAACRAATRRRRASATSPTRCATTSFAPRSARHQEETVQHVERIESAFLRIEVAPTANLSRPFESAVAQHDELALERRRADARRRLPCAGRAPHRALGDRGVRGGAAARARGRGRAARAQPRRRAPRRGRIAEAARAEERRGWLR